MRTAKVVTIELDDPDPAASRARYLESVLKEARAQREVSFKIRFQCDVAGSCHWNGRLYTLEVHQGACSVKVASGHDEVPDRRPAPSSPPAGWTRADKGTIVRIREPLEQLTGEALSAYLGHFLAEEVLET